MQIAHDDQQLARDLLAVVRLELRETLNHNGDCLEFVFPFGSPMLSGHARARLMRAVNAAWDSVMPGVDQPFRFEPVADETVMPNARELFDKLSLVEQLVGDATARTERALRELRSAGEELTALRTALVTFNAKGQAAPGQPSEDGTSEDGS